MLYINNVKNRLSGLNTREPVILGIETSCDDTSAAVLRGNSEVLSMRVHSQIELHSEYGGVVPELASRDHAKNLGPVVSAAISDSGVSMEDIDAIAVTHTPGLLGALLTGLNYAKGMAFALGVPLLAVNHIWGHVAANYLTNEELKPPFICLVASGGHSQIVLVTGTNEFKVLGGTRDDAAGESLDKLARMLGLSYPGGPQIEELAKKGNAHAYGFKSVFNESRTLDFSFSGIKTAAVNLLQSAACSGKEINHADIAASFQRSVMNTLVRKTISAARDFGIPTIAVAGGVSSNLLLREQMSSMAEKNNMRFFCPAPEYCTDNAAMIACAGYYLLKAGIIHSLATDACANMPK